MLCNDLTLWLIKVKPTNIIIPYKHFLFSTFLLSITHTIQTTLISNVVYD